MTIHQKAKLVIIVEAHPMKVIRNDRVLFTARGKSSKAVLRYLVESGGNAITLEDLAPLFKDTGNPIENANKTVRQILHSIWGIKKEKRSYAFDESIIEDGEVLLRFRKTGRSDGIYFEIAYDNPKVFVDVTLGATVRHASAGTSVIVLSQAGKTIQSSISNTAKLSLLKEIVKKHFKKGITDNFLELNINTLNFRQEWQFLVNPIVSETNFCLRAMVFDSELTHWWNSPPGMFYMITNIRLIKNGKKVKRLFIINSQDMRIVRYALQQAYLHKKIGVDVKVCENLDIRQEMPFAADMLSIHDTKFAVLYYFKAENPLTNIVVNGGVIDETCSFYEEIFNDDRLCNDVEMSLQKRILNQSFFHQVDEQAGLLEKMAELNSVTETVLRLQGDSDAE